MRKKLNIEEKKRKISFTICPLLFDALDKNFKNKSKYIEKLIYLDLLRKKIIEEDKFDV